MADKPEADALYDRAFAACQDGRLQDGITFVRKAVAIAPEQARLHRLLGMALSRLGRNEEALESLDRAISRDPARADLFGSRGDVLAALGQLAEAVASYDRAVAINPDSFDDWCNRGNALAYLGKHEEAIASFERAIALAPEFAPVHYNRGNALAALGRNEKAVASFDKAVALDPTYADAYNNRANALDRLGLLSEALASAERALAIDPDHRGALVTSAVMLRKLGRAEQALAVCDRGLALMPDDTEALTVRGDVLIDLERHEQAMATFDRVIALSPDAAGAKWNRSLLCLGLGRFEEGWELYEHRWTGAKGLVPRGYRQPRWDGGSVEGPLLVWGEQGLGDEILHSGMLPDAIARTGEIVFEVEPRLAPLFARSFPDVKVIPLRPELYSGPVAAQTPLGSLGRHFRTRWDAFPKRDRGYLLADEDRTHSLRARLGDGRRVIGLSWISKAPIGGELKSARLSDFAALLQLPGCRFIDLQYGETGAEREAVESSLGIRVERLTDIDNTNDLDGLAALMSACDAVATVSNTTAHLAGALGRPTWVMVPHGQARIWYWFKDREMSPWYPRVRVLRQHRGQGWTELVAMISTEIRTGLAAERVGH
jgi:tetratricopeptide (TPR) repeat protein